MLQLPQQITLNDFYQFIEHDSPNAIYYATKERIEHAIGENASCVAPSRYVTNAIGLAAFFGHLHLVKYFVNYVERVDWKFLLMIAIERDDCLLEEWLSQENLQTKHTSGMYENFEYRCSICHRIFPIGVRVIVIAAQHCAWKIVQCIIQRWLKQEYVSLSGLVDVCLASPAAFQKVFSLINDTEKSDIISYCKGSLKYVLAETPIHIDSLRLFLQKMPQKRITTKWTSFTIVSKCSALYPFDSMLCLSREEIYELLSHQNQHHPGAKMLLQIMDGNTIKIQQQSCVVKQFVFETLCMFCTRNIQCMFPQISTMIVSYLGSDFPPGW